MSVPSLLPQIEGVLIEYVTAINGDAKLGKMKEVLKVVIGDPMEHSFSTWIMASTLLCVLQTNTYMYHDFQVQMQKSTRSRAVTRHTVLHGVSTKYNTASNSLRCFLLLDAIAALTPFEEQNAN